MLLLHSGLFLAPELKPSLNSNVSPNAMTQSPSFNPLLALCQLPAGAMGRVRELNGDSDFCQRVREMGFGESAFVTKISGNASGPFICQVNGTRIALSHGAAMGILVEQLGRH
jgi:ferrous iron transport protein A